MAAGVGLAVASNNKEASSVYAAEQSLTPSTGQILYTHDFSTKPTANADNTLSDTKTTAQSSVVWTAGTASNLNGYNTGNYKGIQLGAKSKTGSISFETKYNWGSVENTTYYGYTVIKKIALFLNNGNGTISATVKVGGTNCTSSGSVSKNSSATSQRDGTSKVEYTPASGHDSGKINIAYSATSGGGYFCAIQVLCEEPPVSKTLSSITLSGTHQTSFTVGDTFSYSGLIVTAHYSDESTGTVTPTSVTTPDLSTTGSKQVTVSYIEGGITKTATYNVTVNTPVDYTITYDANGGTGTVPTSTVGHGSVSLPSSAALTNSGYVLDGWGDDDHRNNTTAQYALGASYMLSADITLYAHWSQTYTVSFNGNGGTGTMTDVPNQLGSYTLPASTFTAPSGKTFAGWKAGNAGSLLAAGSSYNVSSAVTFYAQWSTPEMNTIYGKYQLCTSIDDLVENGHYIIANSKTDGSANFVSTESNTNNRRVVSSSISNSQVTVEEAESGHEIMVFKLGGSTDAWTFETKNYEGNVGYLHSATSGTSNNLLIDSYETLIDNAKFTISISSGTPTIKANEGNRTYMRYNTSSTLFSLYSTNSGSGQENVYLFKQIEEVAISSIIIPSTYGGSGSEFYEGQDWTVSPTYNSEATTKTSEIVVLTNSNYVDVNGYTISAKTGVIPSSTATITFKMHATDVAESTVYSNVCTITITKATVTKVEVTTLPTDVSYVEGQTLDLTGMVTTLTWNYGGTTTLSGAASGLSTTPSLSTSLTVAVHNEVEVLVTYSGVTTGEGDGFTISVIAKAVANNGLSWSGMTSSYGTDGTFIADGSLTVTWNDDTQDTFNVATSYASGDITFKIGDAEDSSVAISEGDILSSENNGQKIFLYFGGHYTSQSIAVREINIQFLTRVESTADLVAGEKYIIAARHGSATYVMTSDVVSKPAAIEWDGAWSDEFEVNNVKYPIDSLRADLAAYGWTLGGQEDAWTWTAADGDSLAYSSSTNFNSTGTSTWKIGVSGVANSGYWKISNTASTDRVVTFREGSTMAFAPYSNSNPQGNTDGSGEYHYVELYRVLDVENTTLETWADTISYIDELNCVDSGSYSFNSNKSWSKMAEAFEDLDLQVKAYIRHASYSYNGETITATNATDSNVANFVCKYDYVVDKYGWSDFIGRNGTTYDFFNSSEKVSTLMNIISENTNTIAIIVIISMVSVTAIGGYFFLRKRKENN